MKKFTILALLFFSLFVFAETAEAKVLPQAKKSGKQATPIKASGGGTTISVLPKIRADRKALIVNFSNLQNATSVSYFLIYKTAGQEEGATGALTLNGSLKETSELLFGTCSKNVCRYHTNITDARLEVSYTSKTGKKYLKKYRIRV